jgi:hypothetical protein
MDADTFYLFFAAISGIGALWMVRGKTLDKNERTGVWIIFSGFALQTVWYVYKSSWTLSAIILFAAFVAFSLIVIFGFKKKGLPTLKI